MAMTLSPESIEEFHEWLIESGRSLQTARAYVSDLKTFLSWTGTPSIDKDVHESLGMAWLTESRKELMPASVKRRMSSIKTFAKWAKWGPTMEEYRPPSPAKAVPHPLPDGLNDVWRLLDASRNVQERALVALCALVGCRVSEARSIRKEDIDVSSMDISIRGKGDKTRVLPLSMRAWEQIANLYLNTKDGVPLVRISDRQARQAITELGELAGVSRPISSHDLRSTFATVMYDKTLNLRLVQDLMGHASSSTTELYTAVTHANMRKAVSL